MGQAIFQQKKLSPPAAKTFAFTKNLPYLIPSFQALLPPEAERTSL
jgi:hypothetical protein